MAERGIILHLYDIHSAYSCGPKIVDILILNAYVLPRHILSALNLIDASEGDDMIHLK